MRIDKYLKVSRLIKRRTVANDACGGDRVLINGKAAKPGDRVKIGDIITLRFGSNTLNVEVLSIDDHVSKDGAKEMYRAVID
ncbi:MAG: RNA-binding S4 domain-containing protein [Bacillota bacterium]|nr:RNA-binding S4 domain-containing protein [Bacillota bacterium]